MDDFFNTKRYLGVWRRNERFREFGDIDNFWIELDYYVSRDAYASVKNTRGAALDFNILDGDGRKIFADVPAAALEEMTARNYVLGKQTFQIIGDNDDLFLVTETYVYAPSGEYVVPDFDIVPVWGLDDNDYATSSPIVFGTANERTNQFYNHSILKVENAAAFKTGDTVIAEFTCVFGYADGLGSTIIWHYDAKASSGRVEILYIDRTANTIEFSGQISAWTPDDQYFKYTNHTIDDNQFYKALRNEYTRVGTSPNQHYVNGSDTMLYMLPLSGRILRAYSTRSQIKRFLPTRRRVSFSMTPPANIPDIFHSKKQSGFELTTISRTPEPDHTEWKRRCALAATEADTWVQYEGGCRNKRGRGQRSLRARNKGNALYMTSSRLRTEIFAIFPYADLKVSDDSYDVMTSESLLETDKYVRWLTRLFGTGYSKKFDCDDFALVWKGLTNLRHAKARGGDRVGCGGSGLVQQKRHEPARGDSCEDGMRLARHRASDKYIFRLRRNGKEIGMVRLILASIIAAILSSCIPVDSTMPEWRESTYVAE